MTGVQTCALPIFAIAALLGTAVDITPTAHALAQGAATGEPSSATRTHVVREGDTLWELARTYLGDPHKWELLYRLNLGVVLNPRWIEPGMVLQVGGNAGSAVAGRRGALRSGAAVPAAITDVRVETPGEPTESVIAPREGKAATEAAPTTARPMKSAARATAVRPGDHLAAPFAGPLGGVASTGRLETMLGTTTLAATPALRSVQYRDRVRLRLPTGATGARGEQLQIGRAHV